MNSVELKRQSRYTAKQSLCQVCNDTTLYYHYGALVCPSCKTFFRRYAIHTEKSPRCYSNHDCPITVATRGRCGKCRFAKCLAVGMTADYIRKDSYPRLQSRSIRPLNLLNADRSNLSQTDWTSLSNVIHAFDRFIPISTTKKTIANISKHSSSASDLSEVLAMFTSFYSSTEAFLSSSADFQILTLDEKTSIFQRNLHGVLHLCATFIFRLSGMFDSPENDRILISIYGHEIFRQTKRIALQLDYEPAIIKLFLFILAFSSSCYPVNLHENMHNDRFSYGTYRLFGSQNVYLEILWKYLIYRYKYLGAALYFTRIIKLMLDLLRLSEMAQENIEIHQNFVENIDVLVEQSLSVNESKVIPLWGKDLTAEIN